MLPPNTQQTRIALLGFGTVGEGVFRAITAYQASGGPLSAQLSICRVVIRQRIEAVKSVVGSTVAVGTDPLQAVMDPETNLVVELMGGIEPALSCIKAALQAGKPVITANKAVLAQHGPELLALAQANRTTLCFEAAIAGGVPVVKVLREGLAGNRVSSIVGIINGTCNFILSEMMEKNASFEDSLKEAQKNGFAEADPSFDVNGTDAAHKIATMAALAYDTPICFDELHIEGIEHLHANLLQDAATLGYTLKLLAVANRTPAGLDVRVHPALIPANCLLAQTPGVTNAIWIQSEPVGDTWLFGPGAGMGPTASAVLADILDVIRLEQNFNHQHVLNPGLLRAQPTPKLISIEHIHSAYFLCLTVQEQPGALTSITQQLAAHQISIRSIVQKEQAQSYDPVTVLIVTSETQESNMAEAAVQIQKNAYVTQQLIWIRMVSLD